MKSLTYWFCLCVQGLFVFLLPLDEVCAKDLRLALLVGNQIGWQGDPKLQHVVSGDLQPLRKILKRSGFEVFETLVNVSPNKLRQVLARLLHRIQQKPRVTTFFFYYTGHADKEHFHMGAKGKRPFSYRELVLFLSEVKAKRRFGVIDACFSGEIIRRFGNLGRYRKLLHRGVVGKGVMRRLKKHDLSKFFPHQEQQVRGLQLLGSSRHLSFESNKLKGSVFTHFLLQGLRGEADLNRDGLISFNELFLFAKPRVKAYTGQSPQQWLFRVGEGGYGFVPVYQSQLRIDAEVVGRLQVVIGNFVWDYQKKSMKRIKLAVTAGTGRVRLKHKRKCFSQELFFPKGGSTRLSLKRWKKVSCDQAQLIGKGQVLISGLQVPFRPLRNWLFEAQMGGWFSSGALKTGGDVSGLFLLGARWRFLGLFLGLSGSSVGFSGLDYVQVGLEFRAEVGYRKRWRGFELFVGGFSSFGTLLQDLNADLKMSFYTVFGGVITPALWLNEQVCISVAFDLGVLPSRVQADWRFFLIGSARVGLRFFF